MREGFLSVFERCAEGCDGVAFIRIRMLNKANASNHPSNKTSGLLVHMLVVSYV